MRRVTSTLLALFATSGSAFAEMALNLTQGVSPVSHDVYELHMLVFWVCVAIGVVVFGVMFYSMYYHRKSRGVKPAKFHSHPALEITWTIIPAFILVLMAVPATKVLLNMNSDEQEDVTIKITGYQWKWRYEYLEDDISFFSNLSTPVAQLQNKAPKGPNYLREVDHPLVLPVHKKIRFLITSNDVNHSWWVPDFAIKRDAVSGFINEAWVKIDKPGTYYGQCAELCGVNHAYMPIVVIVKSEQGYNDWVAKQKGQASAGEVDSIRPWARGELMKKGEAVYNRVCAACHQPDGTGLEPTFPAVKGGKVTTGPVEHHIDQVFNGKAGTAMQAFKGQLTDAEIAAVITYERNAWGNNKGDMVQPVQIKTLRDGKSMKEALTAKPDPNAVAKAKKQAASIKSKRKVTPVVKPAPAKKTAQPVKKQSPVEKMKAAMQRGKQVYVTTCSVCHQPNGAGIPPTFPALKGGKIVTGDVVGHVHQVVFGKRGTAMMAFMSQLTDQQIADVVTFERNAWGNNKGDLVTPEMVKKVREKGE